MNRTTSESPLAKIASYSEILAKEPRSTVFVPLAETYRQIGMLTEGLEVAMKGVRGLPDFSPGFTVLGRIQAQKGDLPGAALSLERALAIDSGNVVALKSLARIRQQQGDVDRALKLLQRVAVVRPEDESIKKLQAKLLQQLSEKQGRAEINNVPVEPETLSDRGKPDPISTLTIAELYIRQGFPQRAMKVYRDLLRVDPNNNEVRQRLIDLKMKMGGESMTQNWEESPSTPPAVETEPVQKKTLDNRPEGVESARPLSLVEVLNRWLDAIQNRRIHV